MHDVVIVDALRSATGRFRGGLSSVRADDLASYLLGGLVSRTGLDPARIDEVFMGCANQAGEDNRNVARMATLLAGFPNHVSAVTVNRLCASGLEAVNQAVRMIKVGDAKIALAGGVENMSRAPFSMPKSNVAFPVGHQTIYDTTLGWRYPNPRMEALFPLEAMGNTAENLVEQMGISRFDQDEFAFLSHQKALAAQDADRFSDEILPINVPQRKGPELVFDTDEGPRRKTSLDLLAKLRPVFKKGGTVTAGNSSSLNDGASALLLMRRDLAIAEGFTPLARVRAMASAGVDPTIMGIGPVPATKKALKRAGMTIEDIELIELNEAFAAQSLAVIRQLNLDPTIINVNGGAIALGHPLGASGAKILTTLLHEMKRRDLTVGLASLCVGVGQGVTTIVERI